MLDRKQIIMIVSIAVVSFLSGTALNTIAMAINGNPFDRIWEAIYGFQNRVEAIEGKLADSLEIEIIYLNLTAATIRFAVKNIGEKAEFMEGAIRIRDIHGRCVCYSSGGITNLLFPSEEWTANMHIPSLSGNYTVEVLSYDGDCGKASFEIPQ